MAHHTNMHTFMRRGKLAGNLPSEASLRAIKEEMRNARHHFPTNKNLLSSLIEFVDELQHKMTANDKRDLANRRTVSAVSVYMQAVSVAVMAIRIMEEGDAAHSYGVYTTQDGTRIHAYDGSSDVDTEKPE